MNARTLRYFAPLAVLALLGQGCLGGGKTATGPDGGVYLTKNSGTEWAQLKTLSLGTKLGSIANVGTSAVALDPQDPQAIYVGTAENGLIYSLDGGASWQNVKSANLNTGRVRAIAVDAKDKCTVFATRQNQVFKTDTCGRDWSQVFFDPRTDKLFTSVASDWFNDKIVYAGTSDGDIFQSLDGGGAWRSVYRIDGIGINNITIDPRDSRTIFASTNGRGIIRSVDGGTTWTQINQELSGFDGARKVTQVVVDPTTAKRVYAISKYGIVRSNDNGNTWEALALPTPPGSIDLKALTINPKDSQKMVYATATSIVFSEDGGVTWTPKKLPTKRGVAFLAFTGDPTPALLLGAPVPPSN